MKELDDGGRRWLLKTARSNYWRVAHFMDFDDLVQDGFWQWCRIASKYSHINHMPHLMSLFKITFINHLNSVTKKNSRVRLEFFDDLAPALDGESVGDHSKFLTSDDYDTARFIERMSMAPDPVRSLLNVLLSSDELTPLKGCPRQRLSGVRETTNERLCRLIGIDPTQFDLHKALYSFLKETP